MGTGDVIMAPNLLLSLLLLVTLVLLCFLVHVEWPPNPRAASTTSLQPEQSRRKRSPAPQPCIGLIRVESTKVRKVS